jgi:hypothetical protein
MGFGGGAFGTGSYAYSVIDNQTIKLNNTQGVIYANATISELVGGGTTTNGAVSGTITYSMPSASTYYKKFIAVLDNFVNTNTSSTNTTNFLSNSGTSGIGEAPQLSSTYAEYDSGAKIFPYYQAWGGLSVLPSSWTANNGVIITYASTYIELTAPSSTGNSNNWSSISFNPIPSSLSSTTTIWEFYGNMYNSTQSANFAGTTNGVDTGSPYYAFVNGNSSINEIYLGNNSNFFAVVTGYYDTNNNKVYTMQMNSATSVQMLINYNQIFSTTSATAESPTYFNFATNDYWGVPPPVIVYWFRTRALPPNDVMPSVSLGTLQAGGTIRTPSGINEYIPITITNNQSVASPSPFQQMIQINLNNYPFLQFNGNNANFEFFDANGNIIPAWIESNNNGLLTIWVNLSGSIEASSSITIYLGIDAETYTYNITYPTAFTTENNITYIPSGITASTTLTTLTLNLIAGLSMSETIIVEGY